MFYTTLQSPVGELYIAEESGKIVFISFEKANGSSAGGSSSWTERNDENWKAAFSSDAVKDVMDYNSICLSSPTYILTDEYVFTLN